MARCGEVWEVSGGVARLGSEFGLGLAHVGDGLQPLLLLLLLLLLLTLAMVCRRSS